MPFTPDKAAGDLIRALDWNDAMEEVIRLDDDKVNRSGAESMTGPLSISDTLTLGPSGNELIRGDDPGTRSTSGNPNNGLLIQSAQTVEINIDSNDLPSDMVAITTGSARTEIFRVQENGNVGIGTTTPTTQLSLGRPVQARMLALHDNPSDWYGLGIQSAQMRLQVGNTDARFSFFADDANELVTIRGNGNVGIGTTNPGARLHVEGDSGDLYILRVRASGNTKLRVHGNGGTSIGVNTVPPTNGLRVQGNAIKPGGGSWSGPSDERLKKNIKPLEGALAKLLQLRGVNYEWEDPEKQGDLTGEQTGMVAQEVEAVFPEWISEDEEGYKILSIRGFEALTVEAFKELKAENDKLQEANKELESRVSALEKEFKALSAKAK